MLETRLPAALSAIGFSAAEVAHALRSGGPLDEITHRTWCESCNRCIEITLRELLGTNGICRCGGQFHIGERSRDLIAEIAGRLDPSRRI